LPTAATSAIAASPLRPKPARFGRRHEEGRACTVRERARLDEAARHFAYISKPGVLDDKHRRAVAEALSSGKKVPARVLDEYPDLAGRRVSLSRAVEKFNRANEPPDGFSDADLVRNARPLGLASTSTPAAVHPIVVGAIVVGTVGGALLLGRMFVNALATR
jgi:hypothetical protein